MENNTRLRTNLNSRTESSFTVIPFRKVNTRKVKPHKSHSDKQNRYFTSDGRPLPRAADPIKDKETVQRILSYFLNSNQTYKYRNHMLFVMGINLGRRCSDLLDFTISDVFDCTKREVRDRVYIREQKTKKPTSLYLNDYVKHAILLYINSLKSFSPDDWLFYSRKANSEGEHKIGIVQAWRILNDVSKALNITDIHMGTHTMRKTFGYKVYNEYPDSKEALTTLMDLFGHSSPKITLRYIGDLEDSKTKIISNLSW